MVRRAVIIVFLAASHFAFAAGLECWNVEDIRPGMRGHGDTVIQGTDPERFEVEIIGVLRDVKPGRDMVIARFSGLGLEKSGVMSGMSGSPVYIDGKILGAVAYTWEFGLEPIGGITPFKQMVDFCDAAGTQPNPVAALEPGRREVSQTPQHGRLLPIRTPLAVSGMSSAALAMLSRDLQPWGIVPTQGGAANPNVVQENVDKPLEPGSAMAVGLVLGDVSATAVGTVTAVHDGRVYAFGHPFLELGRCNIPLMSAYIHTVMPLQSSSFKVGSVLSPMGSVLMDASTGIAGNLGPRSSMVPVTIHAKLGDAPERTFHCEVAPIPALFSSLVMTSVGSCLDSDGKAPIELTSSVRAKVELDGYDPLTLEDTYAGESYMGPPGLIQSLSPLATVLSRLSINEVEPVRITSIECWAEVSDKRRSAQIIHAHVLQPEFLPGERMEIVTELQPYRSLAQENAAPPFVQRTVSIEIPRSLPPGTYTASLASGPDDYQRQLRHHPRSQQPRRIEQLHRSLTDQLAVRRTDLVVRIETPDVGVGIDGEELPDLPTGIATILANDPGHETYRLPGTFMVSDRTEWSLEGSTSITFTVVEKKTRLSAKPSSLAPREVSP